MKLAIRIFAMTIALAGLVSSSFSTASPRNLPSHLAPVTAGPGPLSLPVPFCAPGVPGCGK
jgi:hypothetical protein